MCNISKVHGRLHRTHIPFYKTYQIRKWKFVISDETKKYVCLVLWFTKCIAMRPKKDGQLFVQLDGSPLTRLTFCSVLGKSLEVAGLLNLGGVK